MRLAYKKKSLLVLLCLLTNNTFGYSSSTDSNTVFQMPRVIVRAQTIQESFEFLLYVSQRLPWYNANGYKAVLPEHPALQQFYGLDALSEEQIQQFKSIYYTEVYNPHDYEKALKGLQLPPGFLETVFERLTELQQHWNFKIMDDYQIVLTLYGPGGNYSAKNDRGIIRVKTDSEGRFKRPVLETIVHEIVHLGIENHIVQHYNLAHWEKERMVDLICSTCFQDILPDYWMQPIQNTAIDSFVSQDTIHNDLIAAIELFVSTHPR